MKAYNHSLDFTVLALAHAVDGDYATAGKLLLKASKAHDVKRAVAILEASNAQAFAAQQGKTVKASTKAAGSKTRVRAFDIGDDGDIDDLVGDADEEEVDAELEEDEDEEEDEEGGDFDKAFASVLNGMKGRAKRK